MIRFDNHAFKGLDESLRQLYDRLQSMGDCIEQLLALLPRALEVADPSSFEQAKAIDKDINESDRQVDLLVASIINKFTTSGEDLRFVLGALKISSQLERVADKLKNCLKRLSRRSGKLDGAVKAELTHAIAAVERMVPLALQQILDYDAPRTQELLLHGATVQKSYRQILIHLHHHDGKPNERADDQHLLLVAKNLEQAADMAVEIMEISHFVHFVTKYKKEKDAAASA